MLKRSKYGSKSLQNALIDLSYTNQIIERANLLGLEIEQFEGTLIDAYIIHTNGLRMFKYSKGTKYILLDIQFLNHWSSANRIIMTDSDKKAEDLRRKFDNN